MKRKTKEQPITYTATTRTFRSNTLYQFKETQDSNQPEFCFAKSTSTASGYTISDCWVVDVWERRHPAYNESIPVHINSLLEVL